MLRKNTFKKKDVCKMLMKLTLGDEENLDFEEKKVTSLQYLFVFRDGLTRSVTLRFTNLNVSSGRGFYTLLYP